jgi:hypothetical protein
MAAGPGAPRPASNMHASPNRPSDIIHRQVAGPLQQVLGHLGLHSPIWIMSRWRAGTPLGVEADIALYRARDRSRPRCPGWFKEVVGPMRPKHAFGRQSGRGGDPMRADAGRGAPGPAAVTVPNIKGPRAPDDLRARPQGATPKAPSGSSPPIAPSQTIHSARSVSQGWVGGTTSSACMRGHSTTSINTAKGPPQSFASSRAR